MAARQSMSARLEGRFRSGEKDVIKPCFGRPSTAIREENEARVDTHIKSNWRKTMNEMNTVVYFFCPLLKRKIYLRKAT